MITLVRLMRTMDKAGHNPREMAELVGIHLQTWYWWQRKGFNPTLRTLEKVEDYLRRFERRRR